GDPHDHRVVERRALPQRRPGLGGDGVVGVEPAQLALSEGRVQLDLVDRGNGAGLGDQGAQVVDGEIGDADGTDPALTLEFLEGAEGVDEAARPGHRPVDQIQIDMVETQSGEAGVEDRKSTRLNSSHVKISYAVFCLKKKTS